MKYLISCCCIIYKINPNLPVSSLRWLSSKDRHLHSFLVIFLWSSKSCDFNVFLQAWQGHFNVVVFVFNFGIRERLPQASPAVSLVRCSFNVTQLLRSTFNLDIPFVTTCHQTAVFNQCRRRRRITLRDFVTAADLFEFWFMFFVDILS